MIYLTEDPRSSHGYRTEVRFSIGLHKRDLIVLAFGFPFGSEAKPKGKQQIKAYFGGRSF
jgi:hypothetical protein